MRRLSLLVVASGAALALVLSGCGGGTGGAGPSDSTAQTADASQSSSGSSPVAVEGGECPDGLIDVYVETVTVNAGAETTFEEVDAARVPYDALREILTDACIIGWAGASADGTPVSGYQVFAADRTMEAVEESLLAGGAKDLGVAAEDARGFDQLGFAVTDAEGAQHLVAVGTVAGLSGSTDSEGTKLSGDFTPFFDPETPVIIVL